MRRRTGRPAPPCSGDSPHVLQVVLLVGGNASVSEVAAHDARFQRAQRARASDQRGGHAPAARACCRRGRGRGRGARLRGGRRDRVGFPKRLFDEITLEPTVFSQFQSHMI